VLPFPISLDLVCVAILNIFWTAFGKAQHGLICYRTVAAESGTLAASTGKWYPTRGS